jgi:hypothetical protein
MEGGLWTLYDMLKVKLSLCLTKYHAMKKYGELISATGLNEVVIQLLPLNYFKQFKSRILLALKFRTQAISSQSYTVMYLHEFELQMYERMELHVKLKRKMKRLRSMHHIPLLELNSSGPYTRAV